MLYALTRSDEAQAWSAREGSGENQTPRRGSFGLINERTNERTDRVDVKKGVAMLQHAEPSRVRLLCERHGVASRWRARRKKFLVHDGTATARVAYAAPTSTKPTADAAAQVATVMILVRHGTIRCSIVAAGRMAPMHEHELGPPPPPHVPDLSYAQQD